MEKLRKSFKSISEPQTSQKPTEEKQGLLNLMDGNGKAGAADVVVKINGNDATKETELASQDGGAAANIWRENSYDFSKGAAPDFDFGNDSPVSHHSPLSRIPESESPNHGHLTPREVRVSLTESIPEQVRRRSNASAGGVAAEGEVVLCSSNNSFRRKSTFLKTKTKSRMLDPLEPDQKSQRQTTTRSGLLRSEYDEDDPFKEVDLPDEYKKMKFSKWTVLQLVSLISIVGLLVCSLTIHKLKKRRVFGLALWKWELMVLVLISGRLVSGWVIRIGVFFIERNFLLRKRVLYFVYGLRNAVQNCLWLALVLIAWHAIFDKKVEKFREGALVLPFVTKFWVCMLVGTIIWLLKTLLVKVLASSFHVNTFFDRIQDSLFNQYVIETLSGLPEIEIEQEQEEEERVMAEVQKFQNAGATMPAELKATIFPKSGRIIGTPTPRKSDMSGKTPKLSGAVSKKEEEGITIDHLHRFNQRNISAWNMKRLMNIIRHGVLTTIDEQLQGATDEDETALQITNECQAKSAAKKIFINVAKPGFKQIYLEDLMRFMREDEALKTLRLFEGATESRGISKRALKNWVVTAFRERRALALSLNDTKTAVDKLHHMLNIVIGIIIVVIWLLILKVATTHFFIFMSSQLLLVVFVFGNTCKTTFEAIIFLFVMHPFDVGDRCEVDGVQMVVEEMNILTTVFLRYDNQKIMYPNSILSTKPISNFYRSPDMGDAIDFCIHISTPIEKIALMKERITSYVDNKNDHWYPAPMIVLRDVDDLNRLKISVWLSHTMNFQDMGERWVRRALLVEEMIKIFRDLDVEYRMLPLDINVRNLPALSSNRLPSTWSTFAKS